MDVRQQIDEARRQFARSLVGRWSTAQGTFKSVMDQRWEIRPDGTGRYVDTGPFGYPKYETRFQWRQSEPFVFELQITELIDLYPESNDEEETDDEPWPWVSVRYDFKAVPTDVGVSIGMVDKADLETDWSEFYHSLAPLEYDGPLEM